MNHGIFPADSTALALLAAASRNATANGSAVNLLDYDGLAAVVLNSAAGTGTSPTLDVKLQHSDDGSTGWADITGAAFAQVTAAAASVQKKVIHAGEVKQYIRAVATIGGTTPVFIFGVTILALEKTVG